MRGRMRTRAERGDAGQMTVEMAVAFPVLIAVAVIAVNALLFFSECAQFDRLARQSVRVHAAAPAYGQNAETCSAAVEQDLEDMFDRSYLDVSVTCHQTQFDFQEYTALLEFSPTLFGMGLRSSVFGVELPRLSHRVVYTVDVYKPGVMI